MTQVNALAVDQEVLPGEFYEDPSPFYHEVRSVDPVHWSHQWDSWLVTRYSDVLEVLSDWKAFSCAGKSHRYMRHLPNELREELRPFEKNFSTGLINSDPPEHSRLRSLVNQAFKPTVIEALRPHVQSIVDGLLDSVQEAGQMDLVKDYAYLLPTTVIAQMLGVPLEDRDQFIEWSNNINSVHVTRRALPESFRTAQNNLLEMREYFRRLYVKRLENPQDDLMSHLAAASVEGDKFTEGELLATNVTLIMAGFESTISLITNGLLVLLRNPHQLEKLMNNPSLIESTVEELLRYVSPVQKQLRVVQEDIELCGKQIRQGQLVAALIGAANRDPERFADPDRLDIQREDNDHLAFGFSRHICVGAHLARIESQIAINTVLQRFPDLHMTDDPPVFGENVLVRTLVSLPVAF